MHPRTRFPAPLFAPKYLLQDLALAREFRVQASLLTANCGDQRYANLRQAVRENAEVLIVDPLTHAFTYRGYLDKPTFTALPYAPQQPFDAAYFRDAEHSRNLAGQVLDYEIDLGTDILVPPYLYTRDLDDGRLRSNLRLIADGLRHRAERRIERPVFAMVCFSGTILESPVGTQDLIDQYREPDVDGYLVLVENFDDRQVSTQMLMGLARLVRGLAVERDVIVCSIASFGQVLTALGANGFSAGVGWLETFREVNLQPGRANFPADRAHRSQFYYFPELLSYLPPDAARDIFRADGSETAQTFACNCSACAEGLPENPPQKKQHFMHRRLREMADLAARPPEDRPRFMRDRIGLALELAGAIEEEGFVRIPTEHFIRWIAVIDGLAGVPAAEADPGPSPEDLDQAIRDVRQRGQDAPPRR